MRRQKWTSMPRAAVLPLAAALATAMVLVACGGGGGGGGGGSGGPGGPGSDNTAPTATLSQTDTVLAKTAPIVVRFSESMNPASLQLGGTLAGEGMGAWSKTQADNDTYTLTPPATGWTRGPRDLTVHATDLAGNALAALGASYVVQLELGEFQAAEVVIGQANFEDTEGNQGSSSPAANTFDMPTALAAAPDGKVFITDYYNHRVLGFNAAPTGNNANADFVLGQSDFQGDEEEYDRGRHPYTRHVAVGSGKMVVTDYSANRVIIYNAVPASGSAEQSVVVGQPDFDSYIGACQATRLNGPEAATVTPNGKLIVADASNHRVLIWNSLPTTNGQPADIVLGQESFTQCLPNAANSTPSALTLRNPSGVWSDGTRLVVSDGLNHRVLIWNQVPTSSFQPADIVLGQPDFTQAAPNANGSPSDRSLVYPRGIASNGIQLAVADSLNHRVLIWNAFPTMSHQPADSVLGQKRFDLNAANDVNQDGSYDGEKASGHVLNTPRGLVFHKDQLFVVDGDNNRVLVFRSK